VSSIEIVQYRAVTEKEGAIYVNFISWLCGRVWPRRTPFSIYHRGIKKADRRDHQGAIDDYTTAIEMPDTPEYMIAMALYNRALAHVSSGDNQKGIEDLNAVLRTDKTPVNVKTATRQKLARTEARARKGDS
jgi:hypothetical protein